MSDASQFLLPSGFRFGATKAGLKKSGRPDFALIVADKPAAAAAAFTANRVIAAPLILDKENLRATGSHVRVVAINAGNANCAAGEAGLAAAHATCAAAAETFACKPEEVFPSSTGIIGVPLPAEKLVAALPALSASLGAESDHFHQVAQAILTTDTVEKTAFSRFDCATANGAPGEIRIAALCKGSGMIHPQLVPHATMLVYILTDALVAPAALQDYLNRAIEVSFNRISVDGDTSTNDTVLLLASGASGISIDGDHRDFAAGIDPGLHIACPPDRCRWRGHHPRGRAPHRRGRVGRRRPQSCQSHCPFASRKDRLVRLRSQLGTPRGRHRLLRRRHRSQRH